MPRLIYIDTNVYLDYFEERSYGLRPANEFAFSLLQRTISCEFELVFSDHLLKELIKHIPEERILDLLELLKAKDKLIKINTSYKIRALASEISKSKSIHYADALHYAIALIANAEAIVTNDKKFLDITSEELKILLPNEI